MHNDPNSPARGSGRYGANAGSVGNLEIAKYLHQVGMLSHILLHFGQSILVSATREQSQGRGDGFVQYLLDLDVNHQRGTVECPPINMIMLIEPTEGLYDYILYTSPLKEAINLQSITLTGMFVEHGTPVTDYEHCEAVEQNLRFKDTTSFPCY